MKLYLDTETFSETPIQFGTPRYAADAYIMILAYAIDDRPVVVVDRGWDLIPQEFFSAIKQGADIIAHNAFFDRSVLEKEIWWPAAPVTQWRCTMAQAYAHSLPGSLENLGAVLGLSQDKQKMKEGKALVRLFCMPRPRNMKLRRATRDTHPEEWEQFKAYAGQDVEALREIHRKLPTWNYRGRELASWHLDQKVNDRGCAFDIDFAVHAIRATTRAKDALAFRTAAETGGAVDSTNQRDAFLAHILAEHGVTLPDLQAATLERRLEDPELPEAVKSLIGIRLQASATSTSKYQKVANCASPDGRVRGLLQWCGAARTGRWAGRQVQPQNFPVVPEDVQPLIEAFIAAVKGGYEDLVYG